MTPLANIEWSRTAAGFLVVHEVPLLTAGLTRRGSALLERMPKDELTPAAKSLDDAPVTSGGRRVGYSRRAKTQGSTVAADLVIIDADAIRSLLAEELNAAAVRFSSEVDRGSLDADITHRAVIVEAVELLDARQRKAAA